MIVSGIKTQVYAKQQRVRFKMCTIHNTLLYYIFLFTTANSFPGSSGIEILEYEVGESLEINCELQHLPEGAIVCGYMVLYERNGSKTRVPQNGPSAKLTYSMTLNEFDNNAQVHCVVELRYKTIWQIQSNVTKLVMSDKSNTKIPEIQYNAQHPAYFTCNITGKDVMIDNNALEIINSSSFTKLKGSSHTFTLAPSNSGSILHCAIVFKDSGNVYNRYIYNMAKYVFTPNNNPLLPLKIGTYLGVGACLILGLVFLFLHYKRKKNTSNGVAPPSNQDTFTLHPDPNQVLYAELELADSSNHIIRDGNDTSYARIIGFSAKKY